MKYCPICTTDFAADKERCPNDGAKLIAKDEWAPGTVIRNKYRIVNCIGRGGMGIVYKAEHLVFKDLWALKVMNPRLSQESEFVRRFYFEAEKQRRLKHRNVVRVDDVDQSEDGKLFIGMEFVDGMPLREMLTAAQGPIALPLAMSIARGVAEALDAADALGIVHRDIKPDNVLLERTAGGFIPKLTDFGVAKLREGTATMSHAPLLTPQYAAPEQWQPQPGQPPDGRTDLYALGMTIYEMIAGRMPFSVTVDREWMYAHLNQEPPPPSSFNAEVGAAPRLEDLVLRMLAKAREDRPASARAVVNELTLMEAQPERSATSAQGGATLVPQRRGTDTILTPLRPAAHTPAPARVPTPAPPPPPAPAPAATGRRVPARHSEPEAEAPRPLTAPVAAPRRGRAVAMGLALALVAGGALTYVLRPDLVRQITGQAPANGAPASSQAAPETTPAVTDAAPAPTAKPKTAASTPPPPSAAEASAIPAAATAPYADANVTRAPEPPTEAVGRPLTGHTDAVLAVAFSPRGRWLVSSGADQSVRVWDYAAGTLAHTLTGLDDYAAGVAIAPSGSRMAVADWDKSVRLLQMPSGAAQRSFSGHKGAVEAVAFSPDGSHIASGGDDKLVMIWDVESGTARTLRGHSGPVEAVAYSPDGGQIASGSDDQTVTVWEAASGAQLRSLGGFGGPVRAVAFSPKGHVLAAGSADHSVRVWDLAAGGPGRTLGPSHTDLVTALAFSPDGRWLASGSGDNTVKLWDSSNWTLLGTLPAGDGGVRGLAFSPDGRWLAAACGDHMVRLWRRPGHG